MESLQVTQQDKYQSRGKDKVRQQRHPPTPCIPPPPAAPAPPPHPQLNLTSTYIPLHTHHLPRSSAAVIGTMEMNSTSLRFSLLTLIVLARRIRAHKRYFLRGAGRKTERETNARGHRTAIWLVDASKRSSHNMQDLW